MVTASGAPYFSILRDSTGENIGESLNFEIVFEKNAADAQLFISTADILPTDTPLLIRLTTLNGDSTLFEKPLPILPAASILYRPKVQALCVAPLNPEGQAWDHKIVHIRERAPDLQYLWLFNGAPLYTSEIKRNCLESVFTSPPFYARYNVGDQRHAFVVFDHDNTSRSETIGETRLAPPALPPENFGSVQKFKLSWDTLAFPNFPPPVPTKNGLIFRLTNESYLLSYGRDGIFRARYEGKAQKEVNIRDGRAVIGFQNRGKGFLIKSYDVK